MSCKTEKLYYENAYTSLFVADVIEVSCVDGGYDVVLDKTAFFPEEGGQYADTGFLGDSRVTDVQEKDGVIFANAGSTSLPKNGTVNSYLILEDNTLCLKDFDENVIKEVKI